VEVSIRPHTAIQPSEWDAFVAASPQGMIYSSYDYISVMAGDWHAVVISSGNTIHAVLPFGQRRKAGITYCLQPIFAHYWGVMFRPIEGNIARTYEQRKHWLKLLIDALPKEIQLFSYNFSPQFDYPLPFFWKGYKLTPRYTCQIDLSRTEEVLWSNLAENNRRDVRKAQKAGITIEEACEPETVIRIFRNAKEADINPIANQDYEALKKVVAHFNTLGQSHTLIAKSDQGEPIAGIIFFRWGKMTVYFFGSTEPAHKASGAMSLIIWEAMRRAQAAGSTIFDFEGSMIEPVERFFRGFGAIPIPYLNISRDSLPGPVRLLRKWRNSLNAWQVHRRTRARVNGS
jgi:hypothetical protein